MTVATPVPPFQTYLVWNREFTFVPRGVPLSTLESAKRYAMTLMDMGDGAVVKKVQVVDGDGEVVWSYG